MHDLAMLVLFAFRHAIARDPTTLKAYIRAAQASLRLGDAAAAVLLYEQACELVPSSTAAQVCWLHLIPM